MGKHQKGVNPKLHFPPYSLLNKVPAFIQQPNCKKKKNKKPPSVSLPPHPSLFSDNPETISGRQGRCLGPCVTTSCRAAKHTLGLQSSPSPTNQSQRFICKTPKSRKERLDAHDRVKALNTQEVNANIFPSCSFFFFFLNYIYSHHFLPL